MTKSGLMVGLGETEPEVNELLRDLAANDVDVATIGQYLQPTRRNFPVAEFVPRKSSNAIANPENRPALTMCSATRSCAAPIWPIWRTSTPPQARAPELMLWRCLAASCSLDLHSTWLFSPPPAAITPLLLVTRSSREWVAKHRFLLGYVTGPVTFWAGVNYWIQFVISVHGGLGTAEGTAVWILFCLAKGLYLGASSECWPAF